MAQPMFAAKRNNSQLKAMFRRISFYTDAAMELVTGQSIKSIQGINTLTQDRVTFLWSIICKPGGGTNGHVVSESSENLFHLLVYYCQHQYRVTWDTDHSIITLVNTHALFGQHDLKKGWDQTITEYVKPVFKYMPKTFGMIEELLIKKV